MQSNSATFRLADHYAEPDWILPPPLPGEWRDLPREKAALLARRLSETTTPEVRHWGIERLRLLAVSFYDGWLLCDIQARAGVEDAEQDPRRPRSPMPDQAVLSFLYGPDGFLPLNGISNGIHEHSASHGIDLSTDARRQDYLRFFCFAVHGEEGPFLVCENLDGIDFGPGEREDEERQRAATVLRPLADIPAPDEADDAFLYAAAVTYADQLFSTRFSIKPDGMIQMLDDAPVAASVKPVPPTIYAGNMRYPTPRNVPVQ